MNVKNIVKVMNFHSLIRVNSARRKVSDVASYSQEIKIFISSVVNNRIFQQENKSLKMNENGVELNIYIGSDYGFCSSFNVEVYKYLENDSDSSDKIIIGKRIKNNFPNVLFYCDKESFYSSQKQIHDIILDGISSKKYKSVNIIFINYINLNNQQIEKAKILPIDFDNDDSVSVLDDFTVDGDISFIINSLISSYVLTEVKMCEALSWASENVQRQTFTTESLKKIDERDFRNQKIVRKRVNYIKNKKVAELNNLKKSKNIEG